MSSILKALKKLENEVSVKGEIRSSLHPSHSKVPSRHRKPGDPPSIKRALIIFSTLVLLVGSGLVLTFKPWEKQRSSTTITGMNADIAPGSPIATKTPAKIPQKTPPIKNSATYDPLKSAAKDATTAARKTVKETPKVLVATTSDEAKTSDVYEKKSASVQPIKTAQSTGENEQTSYPVEDNDRFATIPMKTSSESMLDLQAIAWSERAEKRMVVINGHIVHEGDLVEGAAVKHIGKNEVVFLKGDEKWRQLFRSVAGFN